MGEELVDEREALVGVRIQQVAEKVDTVVRHCKAFAADVCTLEESKRVRDVRSIILVGCVADCRTKGKIVEGCSGEGREGASWGNMQG